MPTPFYHEKSTQKMLSHTLGCWCFILLIMMSPRIAMAEKQPLYLIKSAMIFKMLQYTSWPNESQLSSVSIAFVGDEKDLYDELLRASKNIRVKGKPLIVVKADIKSIKPSNHQVVYLSAEFGNSLHQVAENIRRTDTLLISNLATNQHDLMINFLLVTEQVLAFEVNRSNIIFEKLAIDKDLLLLGGTQIDVAELFRETELALRHIKQDLFDKEAQLKQTSRTLAQEQQQIQRQQEQINKQQQQMKKFKDEIGAQEHQLSARSDELDKLNQDVQQASTNLQNKQQELAQRETLNSQQLNRLRDQGVKVAFLNEQIVEKQFFLATKQEELESLAGKNDEQQGAIISQKKILIFTLIILVVFAALMVFGLMNNASRKRTNKALEQTQANMVTLGGIGRDLTANLDLNQVIEQVYHSLNKVLDAHIFLLGIIDREKNCVSVPLVVEEQKKVPPVSFDLNDESKPAVLCVNQQREVIINTHEQWFELFNQQRPEPTFGKKMTTVVYLPLIIGDKIVGCLSLQSPEPNAYSPEQLGMLRTLSRYVAIAVSNAMGYTELQEQKRKTEEQHREVVAAQQQLIKSEKMASLGMLTSGVAHEINDPANFTHTATFMMEKEIGQIKQFLKVLAGGDQADPKVLTAFDDNFAKLTELSKTAQLGSKRIKAIVDNVRAFGHRDDAKQQLLGLRDLVESTVQLIRMQYDTTKLVTPETLAELNLCYPAKLGQVFMNLTVNACQAIEKSKQQNPQLAGLVEITVEQADNKLTIKVKDNGCGMNEDTQIKLFDPFFTTREDGGGTGLGMTISFGIVKELGGTLAVESTTSTGSVLTICLPINK
jgi:signal transduction histidine kinase/archaellum component FlaC